MRLSLLSLASIAAASSLDRARSGFFETVLQSRQSSRPSCTPTGLIEDACCDFETVEYLNSNLYTALNTVVQTPFFRYHKIDLARECPFWQEDGSCGNIACSVETTAEEHIPTQWRAAKLGKLIPSNTTQDQGNFCALDDEADSEGLYVDLLQNPERFTGYAGPSSSRVWQAIYEENCFTPVPFIHPTRPIEEGGTGYAPLTPMNPLGALSLKVKERKLLDSLAGPRDALDEVCLEKRVFYRLISGLHASISIHICDDYLNQTTGQWAPNLECFITRIAQHPERLQNVYFSYVLLLRALAKSGPQLVTALEETSKDDSNGIKDKLQHLVKVARGCPSTFDERSMFVGPSANILKTEFKQHFTNVSRIMDCVGCDKCRLWGKLQVTGLGTALKILFSDEGDEKVSLSRGETVAFINTVHRFSESLHGVERFRQLWSERDGISDEIVDAPIISNPKSQDIVGLPMVSNPKLEDNVVPIISNPKSKEVPSSPPIEISILKILPSTRIGEGRAENFSKLLTERVEPWWDSCRESVGNCVRIVMRLWEDRIGGSGEL